MPVVIFLFLIVLRFISVVSFFVFVFRQTAKMEVMKDVEFNPIMQDESKGKPRYYTYGVPFFNYGLLPQTWEDPHLKVTIHGYWFTARG